MRFPRSLSSRFKGESGYAVSEFVLLVVPASLLAIPLMEVFGLYQSTIVQEQVSYDIARFAALADVSPIDAETYRQMKDPNSKLITDTRFGSCSILTSLEIQRSVTFWPELIRVPIEVRASCEN
jgi:hypothetical protein